MSYAIIRNANYKKENLAGLYKHNERKNTNYSNKEISKDKLKDNYSIKKCTTTYTNALKILQDKYNLQGRIIKTTNVICELIITSDKGFFERIGKEETKRYFQTAYNFVANYKNLSEEYILSAKVHLDETTPHLHIVFVPVIHKLDTKSGKVVNKIACSEYWKGKDSYRILQDNFYKYLGDYRYILCSNDVNIDAVPDTWGILKINMVEKKKYPHIILIKPAIWVKKNCYVEAQLLIRNLCISKDRLSKIHKISCVGE